MDLIKRLTGHSVQILMVAAICINSSQLVHASPINTIGPGTSSFSGVFTSDDQMVQFSISLPRRSQIAIQTTSFATSNPLLNVLGGFSPVLSLYGADGTFLMMDNGGALGTCGPRAVDAISGYCLDAAIETYLPSGNYFLVLTEDPNVPLGDLADGFRFQEQGDITAALFGLPDQEGTPASNPCWLFNNTQRGCEWGVSSVVEDNSPEPGTWELAFVGIAGGLVLKLRKK